MAFTVDESFPLNGRDVEGDPGVGLEEHALASRAGLASGLMRSRQSTRLPLFEITVPVYL